MVIASFIVAVAALFVAGFSAWFTWQQADTAKKTLGHDSKRLHASFTPEVTIHGEEYEGQGTLTLELVGPDGIEGLEEVTVSIREGNAYRFKAGIDGTSQDRSTYGPFPLPKHEPLQLNVELAAGGLTRSSQFWSRKVNALVRLEINCRAEGYEPWVIRREVELAVPTERTQFVW